MNEQMVMFRNLINGSKRGRKQAIEILRIICSTAAEEAPVDDLIKMAQFLYDLRAEAAQRHAEKN